MNSVRFRGLLMKGHKGLAVELPFDPGQEWGVRPVALWAGRRGYPVQGRLNGVAFESAVVSRMRRFFVLVDASLARKAAVRTGQSVNLTLSPAPQF